MDPWEHHRDLLRTLYSSKDREIGTLRNIMAYMKAEHSFVRSKGQYERQFKKWGFRKNSTSEDWKTIHGKIQKRQLQGKNSAVYKSGRRVQVEKLNKEKRHNFRKVEELFDSSQSAKTACCVERFCQHAVEQPPGTPAGFTVCTPMGDTTPPLLINNLPSLQLFAQLKSFVSVQLRNLDHSYHVNFDGINDINQAAIASATSRPNHFFGQQSVASVNDYVAASAAIPAEEHCDNGADLDLTLLKERRLDDKDLEDIFQISRTGELSTLVLPMLHLASCNLLTYKAAFNVVDRIRSASGRLVFNAVISTRSPATQAIARSLLPAATKSLDLELVRSLLDTGISPNSPIDVALRTPLQYAIAEGQLHTGVLELTQLLLDYGARVDLPWAKDTSSPLVHAAKRGHLGLVQLLLAAGADANAHASTGETTALQALSGARVGGVQMWRAAVEEDRVEIAQLLLNAGADVNAQPRTLRGETALQAAVRCENIALVQVLLSHGANVNAPASKNSETALQAAASAGNQEIIDLLLSWGALDVLAAIESALQKGHSQAAQALLSFAAGHDSIDNGAYKVMALKVGIVMCDHHFVQSLLESNVDLGARTNTNEIRRATALQEAAWEGDVDLVRLLLSFGADVNAAAEGDYGGTALQIAALHGDVELVQLLLGAGADVNSDSSAHGMMALEAAVNAGKIDIVQLLLDSGADIRVQGAAAVMETIRYPRKPSEYLKIRQLLFDRFPSSGVDRLEGLCGKYGGYAIDCALMLLLVQHGAIDEGFALRYAIMQGDLDLVKLALQLGADVNAGQQEYEADFWILQEAIRNDVELEIIQLLLEHGANAQEIARALQWAAYQGDLEYVKLLIRAEGDVNAAPLYYLNYVMIPQMRTALQAAAQQGHLEVVRLLLEEGAEVERSSISVDEEGTALQFAAISGSIAIANELIQRGANVNAAPVGEYGRTALEGAAEHGRLDMVQLLLNLEAEVRGSRALQFARNEGHDGVAMLLLQNGFEDDVRMSG